jgi:hypothetical protein
MNFAKPNDGGSEELPSGATSNPWDTPGAHGVAPANAIAQGVTAEQCANCRWWRKATGRERESYVSEVRDRMGFCHRRSPVPVASGVFCERWPMTVGDDFCGDFEPDKARSSGELTPNEWEMLESELIASVRPVNSKAPQ